MKSNTRRGVPLKDDIPFRTKVPKIVGVKVCDRINYQGANITVYQRNIGVNQSRIAYTARIHDPASATSAYLGYHWHKDQILERAKEMVDRNRANVEKKDNSNYVRLVSRQRAWELWYEGDQQTDGDGKSNPPSDDPPEQ